MRSFEYAAPRSEAEAVELLNDHGADAAILAGGTDLIGLMQRDVVAPRRVVNLKTVPALRGVEPADDGVVIGALTTLEEVLEHPLLEGYRALREAVDGVRGIQMQQQGTVGGDLCHRPNCWYYRNGYGLLGMQNGESLVEAGDNRYHAILGNRGPAKFVSASRFAPALIASGAQVRIIGPVPLAKGDHRGSTATTVDRDPPQSPLPKGGGSVTEEWLPLESFYVTPKTETQGVTVLKPGQLLTHIWLPVQAHGPRSVGFSHSGTYEVLQSEGLDWPLAAASTGLDLDGAGVVRRAKIVMGHVAPTPWVAHAAASWLAGQPINEETAARAGEMAVEGARPLSKNEYKVQLARTAVKRALLRAVGQLVEV